MLRRIIVAIDGPAGAGKSTVARSVAKRLGFIYIDTGAMYRAVALWALRTNTALTDMHRLERLAREANIQFQRSSDRLLLNGEDVTSLIRTPEVAAAASQVAAVPGVRRALVEHQREIGEKTNIVMEGRDIGSVVFPDATVKVFLDASADIRAQRRALEMTNDGVPANASATARDLAERDHRDRTRAEAPLVQAPEAVYIDSGSLSVDEAVEAVLRLVREKTTNGKEYQ